MKIAGMLRVKNEARWIAEVLRSMQPICGSIVMFDDHSTDDTVLIASGIPGVHVILSDFAGVDEARDKNLLVAQTMKIADKPDWIVHIDGDEVLDPKAIPAIMRAVQVPQWSRTYRFQVCYLWDRPDQWRIDRLYGDFWRGSLFYTPGSSLRFRQTGFGGNFHCGNIPADIADDQDQLLGARLKHYGYMDREQRLAKYRWYNSIDPNNGLEDGYRHIVQGDVDEIPAEATLKHAGPLKLAAWP